MKTELKGYTPAPNITTYPHLRVSNKDCVVLFTGPRTGVVLSKGNQTQYSVGDNITEGFHEGSYKALPEESEITLSNKGLL